MPYAIRDIDGNLTGYTSGPQPGMPEEFLPDDHPEIIAYLQKFPIPTDFLKPTTRAETAKLNAEFERNRAEAHALQTLIPMYLAAWAELETAFSTLFYVIVNTNPPHSKVAYAVYYSLGGFDARIGMVRAAMNQLVEENPALSQSAAAWAALMCEAKEVKATRNSVAHGTILTVAHRNRRFTRLTSPPFDVNNVGRPLSKGSDVGLSAIQLEAHLKCLPLLVEAVDAMNRLIADFRQHGPRTLPQRLSELEDARSRLGSPRTAKPPTAKAPLPPRPSSPPKRVRKAERKKLMAKREA